VVDIGVPREAFADSPEAIEEREFHALIQAHMPSDKNSPVSEFLPGFASLCLLLAEQVPSDRERALLQAALNSYRTHKAAGHRDFDVAWMTARDFMTVSKSHLSRSKQSDEASRTSGVAGAIVGSSTCTGRVDGNQGCCPPAKTVAVERPSGTDAASTVLPPTTAPGASIVPIETQNAMFTAAMPANANAAAAGVGGHQDILSFGISPSLHPIVPGGGATHADLLASLAPLGLSASQLAALLQAPDAAAMNFHGP